MPNELLQAMDKLDSQLIILNIEGLCSACYIYEFEEEEIKEYDCHVCDGECEILCDCGYWHECKSCEGSGVFESSSKVQIKEVEMDSNILI